MTVVIDELRGDAGSAGARRRPPPAPAAGTPRRAGNRASSGRRASARAVPPAGVLMMAAHRRRPRRPGAPRISVGGRDDRSLAEGLLGLRIAETHRRPVRPARRPSATGARGRARSASSTSTGGCSTSARSSPSAVGGRTLFTGTDHAAWRRASPTASAAAAHRARRGPLPGPAHDPAHAHVHRRHRRRRLPAGRRRPRADARTSTLTGPDHRGARPAQPERPRLPARARPRDRRRAVDGRLRPCAPAPADRPVGARRSSSGYGNELRELTRPRRPRRPAHRGRPSAAGTWRASRR